MGVSIGPKIVTDGLLINLDAKDLNSFPGESTTNLSYQSDNSLSWRSSWVNSGAATWSSNDLTIDPPFPGYSVLSELVTTTGSLHMGCGNAAVTTSTEYTASVWFWQNEPIIGGSSPYCRPQPHNTNQGYLEYKGSSSWNTWPSNRWIRISKTFTTPATDVTSMYISSYGGSTGNKYAFYAPQIEQKSYMTNFTGPQRTNTTWYDVNRNLSFSLDGSGIVHDSFEEIFNLTDGGITCTDTITNSNTCTVIFWIKTTDTQALFLGAQTTAFYLGAYSSSNKEYYGNCGTPDFYMDTVDTPNIYDYIRDGEWHMLEFKNVALSSWTQIQFNQYGSFTFGNGSIGKLMIYDRNLTSDESLQIYNSTKSRFGK